MLGSKLIHFIKGALYLFISYHGFVDQMFPLDDTFNEVFKQPWRQYDDEIINIYISNCSPSSYFKMTFVWNAGKHGSQREIRLQQLTRATFTNRNYLHYGLV